MSRLYLLLILYDFLYILLSPFIFIYLLSRKDSRKRLKEYLGIRQIKGDKNRKDKKSNNNRKITILIHGVSVGEVLSAIPLVKLLKERLNAQFILSTTIEDALKASKPFSKLFEDQIFLPLDFSFSMKSFLNKISPDAIIISETDFWPNMLYLCYERKIALYLTNGRISQKIYSGCVKTTPLSTQLLLAFSKFYVQRPIDEKRLHQIGIPLGKIVISGNTKYEGVLQINEPDETVDNILSTLGSNDCSYIVGGSTHPGEEKMIMSLLKNNTSMNIKLIIAPRIVNRSKEIKEIASSLNLTSILYSTYKTNLNKKTEKNEDVCNEQDSNINNEQEPNVNNEQKWDILIVDELGVLKYIYSVAEIVFIGGTFSTIGGHNFLEAAIHQKAIITGPDLHNFSEDSKLFIDKKALIQVKTPEEFTNKVIELLATKTADETGKRAFELLMKNQGASTIIANDILEDLNMRGKISLKDELN